MLTNIFYIIFIIHSYFGNSRYPLLFLLVILVYKRMLTKYIRLVLKNNPFYSPSNKYIKK